VVYRYGGLYEWVLGPDQCVQWAWHLPYSLGLVCACVLFSYILVALVILSNMLFFALVFLSFLDKVSCFCPKTASDLDHTAISSQVSEIRVCNTTPGLFLDKISLTLARASLKPQSSCLHIPSSWDYRCAQTEYQSQEIFQVITMFAK
jgi:hypothetical protein